MIKRTACMVSFLAVLLLAAGADDSTPSIKEIMGKLHKGADAPLSKLKTALKSNTPDWTNIQDLSKDFVKLGADLAKNKPPRGDKSAFEKRAEPITRMSSPSPPPRRPRTRTRRRPR